MGPMRMKTTAVVAGFGLIFGLAACGDDDDATSSDEPNEATAGDTAAFCDDVVEFNTAVYQVDLDEDSSEADVKSTGARVGPLMQSVVDDAPADLADEAEELNDAVQPLNEGDAGPFNEDATYEKYTAFVSKVIPVCDFDDVAVTAVDYAFEEVPASIEVGTVAFTLTNESEAEEHEMVLFRRADGEDRSFEELLNLGEEESEDALIFASAASASPGASGSTLADLEAGDYAMACFIPVGGAEDGAPHFTQGMLQEFVVE
jgi:hypothetical protein